MIHFKSTLHFGCRCSEKMICHEGISLRWYVRKFSGETIVLFEERTADMNVWYNISKVIDHDFIYGTYVCRAGDYDYPSIPILFRSCKEALIKKKFKPANLILLLVSFYSHLRY